MMKLGVLISVLLLAGSGSAPTASLKWQREIVIPEIKSPTLISVPLDTHFFEQTRSGWPDVRLLNSEGEAQGFIIRPVHAPHGRLVRRFWNAEQLSAKVVSDQELTIEFALRDHEPTPDGIRIVTPLTDFERQVQLEASIDGRAWESAGPTTLIFDYSRYVNARSDVAPLTKDERRRFRLIVNDLTAEQAGQILDLHRHLRGSEELDRTESTVVNRRPFRIERIEFYRDEQQAERGKPDVLTYPPADFRVSEDEQRHETVVTIGAQRQPLTQIKLLSDSQNFSRAVTVELERDRQSPGKSPLMVSSRLTRFAVGAIQRDETTITIPETATQRLRIAIANGDSRPLRISGVELGGPKYEIVALAAPGAVLKLAYGSEDVDAGQFDTAALEAAVAAHQPTVLGTLQTPRDQPYALSVGHPSRLSQPWNDGRLLIASILAVMSLLIWALYRASLKVVTPPDDPEAK